MCILYLFCISAQTIVKHKRQNIKNLALLQSPKIWPFIMLSNFDGFSKILRLKKLPQSCYNDQALCDPH